MALRMASRYRDIWVATGPIPGGRAATLDGWAPRQSATLARYSIHADATPTAENACPFHAWMRVVKRRTWVDSGGSRRFGCSIFYPIWWFTAYYNRLPAGLLSHRGPRLRGWRSPRASFGGLPGTPLIVPQRTSFPIGPVKWSAELGSASSPFRSGGPQEEVVPGGSRLLLHLRQDV